MRGASVEKSSPLCFWAVSFSCQNLAFADLDSSDIPWSITLVHRPWSMMTMLTWWTVHGKYLHRFSKSTHATERQISPPPNLGLHHESQVSNSVENFGDCLLPGIWSLYGKQSYYIEPPPSPRGRWQWGPLEVRSKAASSSENFSLDNWHPVCPKHMELSNSSGHRIWYMKIQSITQQKWYIIGTRNKWVMKAQGSCTSRWLGFSWHGFMIHAALWPPGIRTSGLTGILYDQRTEEGKMHLVYRLFFMIGWS